MGQVLMLLRHVRLTPKRALNLKLMLKMTLVSCPWLVGRHLPYALDLGTCWMHISNPMLPILITSKAVRKNKYQEEMYLNLYPNPAQR